MTAGNEGSTMQIQNLQNFCCFRKCGAVVLYPVRAIPQQPEPQPVPGQLRVPSSAVFRACRPSTPWASGGGKTIDNGGAFKQAANLYVTQLRNCVICGVCVFYVVLCISRDVCSLEFLGFQLLTVWISESSNI